MATNFTYENTPANLNLTTSYATYSVTASVDTASAKNIIVFIWSDVTTTSAGEFLYLSDVKLEAGQTATPYQHENYSTLLQKCQRHYYQYSETGSTGFNSDVCSSGANTIHLVSKHPVEMMSSPSMDVSGNLFHSINGIANGNRTVNTTSATPKVFLITLTYTHTAGYETGRVTTSSSQHIKVESEL